MHRFPDIFFPETYLVIDIETTGFSPESDYITQFGMAWVHDKKLKDAVGFLLQIPEGSMGKGAEEVTGITEKMCAEQGMPMAEGIRSIHHTLSNWRRSRPNAIFVGHNAAKFDMPFLEKAFDKNGLEFRFGPDEIVDTGCMVKAQQLGTHPLPGEKHLDFMLRVGRIRATGVKWSLDKYCIDRFDLRKRLKQEQLKSHDATSDCTVTHWVLEALRAEREELIKTNASHTG